MIHGSGMTPPVWAERFGRGFIVSETQVPQACPFCHRLADTNHEPPGEMVWSFPNSIAFLGRWQHWQGYVVLVSRVHCREPIHLPAEQLNGYTQEMYLLARAVEKAFAPHKLNYELLGNQVEHPHWHIFPRYASEPERLQPVWVVISAAETASEARQRVAQLEAGELQRTEICHRLKTALKELNATWQPEPA
jgi:diadenosine tetraphosphate (Ap4A) HIT family hydrolase